MKLSSIADLIQAEFANWPRRTRIEQKLGRSVKLTKKAVGGMARHIRDMKYLTKSGQLNRSKIGSLHLSFLHEFCFYLADLKGAEKQLASDFAAVEVMQSGKWGAFAIGWWIPKPHKSKFDKNLARLRHAAEMAHLEKVGRKQKRRDKQISLENDFRDWLNANKINFRMDRARRSNSTYFYIWLEAENEEIKFRFSDHKIGADHSRFDFETGQREAVIYSDAVNIRFKTELDAAKTRILSGYEH